MQHDNGLLVKMTIRVWTGRKTDRKVSVKITKSMHAADDAGVFVKNLMQTDAIKRMNASVKRARRALWDITVPWGDDGTRLLPTEHWAKFEDMLAQYKAEFDEEVELFMSQYEDARRAAKQRFGDMANDSDYPPPEDARRRFKFDVEYANIPQEGDIRVDLDPDQVSEIESRVREQVQDKTNRAMATVCYRLNEALGNLYHQLDDESQTLRAHTHKLVERLVDLMPALNVAGDPALIKAIDTMRNKVMAYDLDDMRRDPKLRRNTAKVAGQVLTALRKHSDKVYPSWGEAGATGGDDD